MRRVTIASVLMLVALAAAPAAQAQIFGGRRDQDPRGQTGRQNSAEEAQERRSRAPRIAPLQRRANAGPCPYVKILYDAARYVELENNQPRLANVGYTGEIEGVTADCVYRDADPIQVDMQLLFNLGRGAQADGAQRTYRYWVAVTERNRAILAKEYFDLPVTFEGQTASVREERTIVIPRASTEVSGGNFEVLVGFDVTPEMAEFNRSGSRFRVNAGAPQGSPSNQ